MEEVQKTLKEQFEDYDREGPLGLDSCSGFYDWFCRTESLPRKAKSLMSKVKTFCKKFNVDLEKHYVFFKNNCPLEGVLYDDFRICDVETGNVIWTVCPKVGYYSTSHDELAQIWGRENDFQEPIYKGRTLTEIYMSLQK